jgi:hypothetical protein
MTIAHRMILDIFNVFIYVLIDSALQNQSAEIVQIHTNACFLYVIKVALEVLDK